MNVQLIDKKEIIILATLTLIHQNGFHGTAMSMIAKQADVSIGTIYHYFPSKDVLIKEIHHYSRYKLFNYIFHDNEPKEQYRERFIFIFNRFITFFLENTALFSFMEQYYSSPYYESSGLGSQVNLKEDDKIYDFLMEGIRSEQLKSINIHTLNALCFGTLASFVKHILYRKLEYSEASIKEVIDIVWTGIKK